MFGTDADIEFYSSTTMMTLGNNNDDIDNDSDFGDDRGTERSSWTMCQRQRILFYIFSRKIFRNRCLKTTLLSSLSNVILPISLDSTKM